MVFPPPKANVVGALIWDRKKEKFLICQRPQDKARAMLWEFVGGKVEAGESREEALIRECREELGIELSVKKLYCEVDHEYPDIAIHLSVFAAEIADGTPRLLEHAAMEWILPTQIDDYCFCPADKPVIEKLKHEYGKYVR